MKKFIMVIDEGTTSTKAFIFDRGFRIVSQDSRELNIFADGSNNVEQDGNEIFEKSVAVCRNAMAKAGISPEEILCIGITNQRGTGIAWDKSSGEPLCRGINWADTRTTGIYEKIQRDGWLETLESRMILPMSSVALLNLHWMINHNETIKKKFRNNEMMFGTVDTWLIYKLTGGRRYITSYSNVSMFHGFDFVTMKWHEAYLTYLGISSSMLPEIIDDSGELGFTCKEIFGVEIPIIGNLADQQSSTFAHRVLQSGMMKCTCGTGTFVDLSVGDQFLPAPKGMFPIATYINGHKSAFQLEGCIKTTGAVFKWFRDDLHLIASYDEIQSLAASVSDSDGVLFLPALTGLGSPYWNAEVCGTLSGLKRSTNNAHIIRAAMEGIAFRIREITEIMNTSCSRAAYTMRIDGGLSESDAFCQIIADSIGVKVERPKLIEATALGAAEIAGIYTGFWNENEINTFAKDCDVFFPNTCMQDKIDSLYAAWSRLMSK